MPAEAKPAGATSNVYVVTHSNGVDSVYANATSAHERAAALKDEGEESIASSVKVELHKLKDGSIQPSTAPAPQGKAPKPKPASASAAAAPKANQPTTKTNDSPLPANIKALLSTTSSALLGLTVVVTGVPATLGRKNAEKLVTQHGGKLMKSLSKNTSYVVVGNDAGPKKLEQIEDLGVQVLGEDGLVGLLEERVHAGGGEDAEDRVDGDGDEGEKPVKRKRAKK